MNKGYNNDNYYNTTTYLLSIYLLYSV